MVLCTHVYRVLSGQLLVESSGESTCQTSAVNITTAVATAAAVAVQQLRRMAVVAPTIAVIRLLNCSALQMQHRQRTRLLPAVTAVLLLLAIVLLLVAVLAALAAMVVAVVVVKVEY
jgi:hypothetical protein